MVMADTVVRNFGRFCGAFTRRAAEDVDARRDDTVRNFLPVPPQASCNRPVLAQADSNRPLPLH